MYDSQSRYKVLPKKEFEKKAEEVKQTSEKDLEYGSSMSFRARS